MISLVLGICAEVLQILVGRWVYRAKGVQRPAELHAANLHPICALVRGAVVRAPAQLVGGLLGAAHRRAQAVCHRTPVREADGPVPGVLELVGVAWRRR